VKLKKTDTETCSLLRKAYGEDSGIYLKSFNKITSKDASRAGRFVWNGEQLQMEITFRYNNVSDGAMGCFSEISLVI
jgi:hypothetical protein